VLTRLVSVQSQDTDQYCLGSLDQRPHFARRYNSGLCTSDYAWYVHQIFEPCSSRCAGTDCTITITAYNSQYWSVQCHRGTSKYIRDVLSVMMTIRNVEHSPSCILMLLPNELMFEIFSMLPREYSIDHYDDVPVRTTTTTTSKRQSFLRSLILHPLRTVMPAPTPRRSLARTKSRPTQATATSTATAHSSYSSASPSQ
jgi:hypothetical protein